MTDEKEVNKLVDSRINEILKTYDYYQKGISRVKDKIKRNKIFIQDTINKRRGSVIFRLEYFEIQDSISEIEYLTKDLVRYEDKLKTLLEGKDIKKLVSEMKKKNKSNCSRKCS